MITPELIDEYLDFDVDDGIFKWRLSRGTIKQGMKAGTKTEKGYIRIYICGKSYFAHRLVWRKFNGDVPVGMEIDHINGIRDDNRLVNLRCVTKQTNMQNQKKAKRDNKSGFLGVRIDRGKFASIIVVSGKTIYLGQYNTPQEAHQVYLDAKRTMHEGCTI